MKNNSSNHLYIEEFIRKNNIEKDYMKYDNKLKDFSKRIDKWFSRIDVEEQEVFGQLLENFKYMTRINVRDSLLQQYQDFKQIEPTYKETVFIPVSSYGGIYNGAINIIENFEEAVEEEDVTKKRIAVDPKSFSNEFNLESVRNIVFLDDIIGSGDTFIDFIIRITRDLPDLIGERKLFLFSLFNLEKGVDNIKEFSEDYEWDITFINKKVKKPIFEELSLYKDNSLKEKHKKIIKKYEKNIVGDNEKEKIYIMGYKKSSALVAFYYNTPNNTFITFWKDMKNEWYPVFKRKEDDYKFNLKNDNVFEEIKSLKAKKLKRKDFIIEQREQNRKKL